MHEELETLEEVMSEIISRFSSEDTDSHQITVDVVDRDTNPHILITYIPLGTRAVAEIDAMVADIAHENYGVDPDDEPMFNVFSNLPANQIEVWLEDPDHEAQFA